MLRFQAAVMSGQISRRRPCLMLAVERFRPARFVFVCQRPEHGYLMLRRHFASQLSLACGFGLPAAVKGMVVFETGDPAALAAAAA